MVETRAGATIRAVVDTSALVSSTQRRELQQLAQVELYTGIWSPWIIAELNRVLTWRWIDRTNGDLTQPNRDKCGTAAKLMMEILLATFELVNPRPPYSTPWETLDDHWDIPIWAAAVEADAQYVISENTYDFPPSGPDGRHVFQDIEYLTGNQFMNRLLGDID